MKKRKLTFRLPDIFVLLVVAGFSTYMYFEARGFKKAAVNLTMIGPLYYAILLFVVLRLIQCFKFIEVDTDETSVEEKSSVKSYLEQNMQLIVMMAAAVVYAIGLKTVGFYITTVIVMPVTMRLLGVKKWLTLALVTVGTMLFFFLVFGLWLGVRLP